MVSVADLLTALGQIASDDKAAAWDPTGLQLGDPAAEVRRVGVAHEITDVVVTAAIENQLDLLITYHPLLFRPIGRLVAGSGPAGRAYQLVRSGVAVGVCHTPWDAAPGGTADALASVLGLVDIVGFGPSDPAETTKVVSFVPPEQVDRVAVALEAAGSGSSNPGLVGRVGELPASSSLAEFSRKVAATLDSSVRFAGDPHRLIRRVAVLPGSGGSHLAEAVETGADVYVSGDLNHHQVRQSLDQDLTVVDPGHAGSERPGVAALFAVISKIVADAVDLTLNPDPWQAA